MFISSPTERFVLSTPAHRDRDMQCPPVFIVPLKLHNAPKGYECYMSCAVTGNPKPRITWYRNHVSLNTDTNYYISNTCGVCSLLILRVGPKDMGEYTITAESTQGRAECSTVLSVRGENTQPFQFLQPTDDNALAPPNRVKMLMSAQQGQEEGSRRRPDVSGVQQNKASGCEVPGSGTESMGLLGFSIKIKPDDSLLCPADF